MSTPPADLDVWILAGQSNMEGCGPLAESLRPHPAVWNFSTAGEWGAAEEPLHRLWESYAPVHQNLMRPGIAPEFQEFSDAQMAAHVANTRHGGAGLGLSFAKQMHAANGRPIGLIAAAHGGTSLEQWNPNRKSEGLNSLYGAMLDRVQRAGGNIKGILWYQGESDCSPEWAPSYAERFDAWVAAARQDLGQPDLPVIVVQLSRLVVEEEKPSESKWWDIVRQALIELPNRVPNTAATSAIDLGLSDAIHVGTPGLIRLGARLAREAQALQAGKTVQPRVTGVARTKSPLGHPVVRVTCENVSGRWLPAQHASGFDVRSVDGERHPAIRVIDASPVPEDPTSIDVLLTGHIPGAFVLGYGLGWNPYCNLVDEADMPLPAFSWRVTEQH